MNTKDTLKTIIASDNHRVKLAIADIDGVLRGKIIHKDKFIDAAHHELGFCDVVFGWDVADASYDNATVTGWHTGYPDINASIDLSTYRCIPWENNMPFFLSDFSTIDHPACSRTLLKKIIKKCDSMGFENSFAQEFEWFNFTKHLERASHEHPIPITEGMFGYSILRAAQNSSFINALFDLLNLYAIPVEGIHTETGPGVYEACIRHSAILKAADRAVLFKSAVKEIASSHGITASFMAKWNETLPGCSGHIHQSLWKNGKNVFYDEQRDHKMSSLLESYIAGQLHCLPEILPMYAPTINSYKRLVEGTWAPTTISWGLDNRTTALRVINGSETAMRVETRVPGADVNPYLAMAAALASGLYGIEHRLKLDQPATRGSGYNDKSFGILPDNLRTANEAMKQSKIAQELFGPSFVDHFTRTRDWECRQYATAVTNWELQRYFEII